VDSHGNSVRRAPIAEPKVTRAVFTTEIRNRSPQDEITELSDTNQYVSFFTDLRKMDGMQVTHRWIFQDVVKYEMTFDVMSDSWQAWSTQRLPVDLPGEWTVQAIDQHGKVLAAQTLMYQMKAPEHIAQNDPDPNMLSKTMGTVWSLLKR
jgi:hypothetical protein